MSNFIPTFNKSNLLLTEGGMVERIKRESSAELDPFILHAGLIYDDYGRKLLEGIYREYIDTGFQYQLPFVTLAATWRANPERIAKSRYSEYKTINSDCVNFLKEIRKTYNEYSQSIFIGGLMACRGDAYNPNEALSKEESIKFHRQQAKELAKSGCDFIKVATLPAVSETLGISIVLSQTNLPYIISFVIRSDGTLLDGTPLHKAIEIIDSETYPKPLFYMINCVHPINLIEALNSELKVTKDFMNRILGFQGNTSTKSPEELDNLEYVDTTEPKEFAKLIVKIHEKYGIKLLGGCCGSDARHIKEIAKQIHLK